MQLGACQFQVSSGESSDTRPRITTSHSNPSLLYSSEDYVSELSGGTYGVVSPNPGGFCQIVSGRPPRVVVLSEFRDGWIWPQGAVILNKACVVMGSKGGQVMIVESDGDEFAHSYQAIPGDCTGMGFIRTVFSR